MGAVGGQIKLLSFLSYMAIYTSMSYTAVIMRNWDASLFGLSKAASASLPLTVELLCIMLCSVAVQKVFQRMKLNHLLLFVFLFLILGNAACIVTSSPYVLLGLRAFCGIGFGLLKYWLNSIVAAGSADSEAVGEHYAQLNAGLLGGITAGASLGAVLAQSLGYQFNYLFTGAVCVLIMAFAWVAMPWKMLNARRLSSVGRTGQHSVEDDGCLKEQSGTKSNSARRYSAEYRADVCGGIFAGVYGPCRTADSRYQLCISCQWAGRRLSRGSRYEIFKESFWQVCRYRCAVAWGSRSFNSCSGFRHWNDTVIGWDYGII